MDKPDIALNNAEQRLFERIKLDTDAIKDHIEFHTNADLVCELVRLLAARNGIPAHRKKWFTDPDYNPGGRRKSRQQVFEQNGVRGEAILRNAHFLEHLRYMLCGPRLPQRVAAEFRKRVRACGHVTSGDVRPLSQCARDLTRAHQLVPYEAAEEFYKLALDCGLDRMYAPFIRDAVKQVRLKR